MVAVVMALLLSCQALAGFQESRWQIIDLLANPEKIQPGLTQDYSIVESRWSGSDLNDGTPRWMVVVKDMYAYELTGSPIKKATLMGGIGQTEQSGYELATRIMLFMRAVGVAAQKSSEVFQTLFNATLVEPGAKYYLVSGGIRVEMIYYDSMSAFMVTMQKD